MIRNCVKITVVAALLAALPSCGRLADLVPLPTQPPLAGVPAELPVAALDTPLHSALNDPGSVLYFIRAQVLTNLPPDTLAQLPDLKLAGEVAVSGATGAILDWYVRTSMDGCTQLSGAGAWSCPAATEQPAFLGSTPITTAARPFGPWTHPRLKSLLTGGVFIGLRVSAGQLGPGATRNARLTVLTR